MSTHGKTRFVCRIVRLRDAMSGPSAAAAHVAHCADCQAYFAASHALVNRLKATAPARLQAVPDDLARRIALAVREATPQPKSRRRHSYNMWLATAGALAVFAFAFHLVRQPGIQPTTNRVEPRATDLAQLNLGQLVAGVDSLRTRLVETVEPSAERLASNNPLTQELASVKADAQSALSFLALNFLPAEAANRQSARTDPSQT
ncbi:MAG: hypothetical protein QM790_20910 [Nibricoccus sp.]